MNKMYLVLGDWSGDGHEKYDKILVESNFNVDVVQQAYKDSCKLTGVSFNYNEDFTGGTKNKIQVATEYEEGYIPVAALEIFVKKFGLTPEIMDNWGSDDPYEEDENFSLNQDSFVNAWIWFVKLSHPNLEIRVVPDKENIPCINGYWSNKLNVQFGYGLYY